MQTFGMTLGIGQRCVECSQSVAKWAYIGGRWAAVVESDPHPNYATVYEIRRSWTVAEHRVTQLEMWCRETGCGFEPRALRFCKSLPQAS